ncbi:hypothetical protein [Negadavirga shengliensis]|uniref:ECF transporter S component n=1 Tax=Negadavirga shengliensis TaxID=1389218 RepID=A0ABV9SX19_9BACT
MQTLPISRKRYNILTLSLVLAASFALPFFIHLIPPHKGIPMGAYLLPMFYMPLIALFLYGVPMALLVALLAPGLNWMFAGNPDGAFAVVLTLELACFTLATHWLLGKGRGWFAAPLGYLTAKVVSAAVVGIWDIFEVSAVDFYLSSVSNGTWGILLLLMINVLFSSFRNKPADKKSV